MSVAKEKESQSFPLHEVRVLKDTTSAHGLKDKYVIIDLRNMDFMKDKYGFIKYFDNETDACILCGMYEFENVWVMKLVFNHIEKK